MPSRVVLQDFTGVPAVVDLATMRDAANKLGFDPKKVNPLVRSDLVIDHSVQVDYYNVPDALKKNIFMPVKYKNILKNIDNKKSDPVSSEVIHSKITENLRPSIETTLHAIMPYKYVVHAHSINCIANTISKNNLSSLNEKMSGFNWSLVPYTKPGLPLAIKIKEALKPGVDIILMANHNINL